MKPQLILSVRSELLLNGKTLRGFSRDIRVPVQTVSAVLRGERGFSKARPSATWLIVMKNALPYLPAEEARKVKALLATELKPKRGGRS